METVIAWQPAPINNTTSKKWRHELRAMEQEREIKVMGFLKMSSAIVIPLLVAACWCPPPQLVSLPASTFRITPEVGVSLEDASRMAAGVTLYAAKHSLVYRCKCTTFASFRKLSVTCETSSMRILTIASIFWHSLLARTELLSQHVCMPHAESKTPGLLSVSLSMFASVRRTAGSHCGRPCERG